MYGRCTIIGWLGDAPKNIGKTSDMAAFSVGFYTTRKALDGKYQGAWIDCIAFGEFATQILSYKKGDLLFIEGNLQENSWTSQDGTQNTKFQLAVNAFRLLKPNVEGGKPLANAPQSVAKPKKEAKKEELKEVDADDFEPDLSEIPF